MVLSKSFTFKIIHFTKSGCINEYFTDSSDIALEQIGVLINDYRTAKVELVRGCFYVL